MHLMSFTKAKLCFVGFVVSMVLLPCLANAQSDRPNIIHIFADDLGWGSVGFNNPSTFIETPNIDSLALAGMRLNRSYSATVCSPSRGNLMTGFHSGHADNDRNGNIGAGLRGQDVTVAEVLTDAGYRSAVLGKWGWGATGNRNLTGPDAVPSINDLESMPSLQGFEFFFGYLNHSAAHDFYYDFMWQSSQLNGPTTLVNNDNGPGGAPEYSHDLIHRSAEAVIRDWAVGSDPFYMQLSFTIPHFDLEAIQTAPALINLAGDVVFPGGLAQYGGNPGLNDKQERYAAMISRMDASIGSIVARLEDPNFDGDTSDSILANTFIFFTSDNGATPEDGLTAAISESLEVAGGLRGGKRDLYEGGIRMPAFVHWPSQIAAGSSTDLINDLSDFAATAADIAGTQARVGVDGVSILPTLVGMPQQQQLREHILFENFSNSQHGYQNSSWALVRQDYKLIQFVNGNQELYRVDVDREETQPLNLNDPIFSTIRDEMEVIAFAEGAAQPDDYAVQFRDWVGADMGLFANPSNWSVTDEPTSSAVGGVNETWSARLVNQSAAPAMANTTSSIDVLGLEVDGSTSLQTLAIGPQTTFSARNEIRIGQLGSVDLLSADLRTQRRITIADGGAITGIGTVSGDCFCGGNISPGIADIDTNVPPAGQFSFAVDFSSIDNRQNKDDVFTPLIGSIPQATISLDYGPSTVSSLSDRGFNDFPAEFNLQGWSTGNQLQDAINGNDYLSVKIAPASGLAVELVGCGFNFFRNGNNSPNDYAILSNIDGFDATSALAEITVNDTAQSRFEAAGTAGLNSQDELELRLYGWNSNQISGHTHINGADFELLFTELAVPDLGELATLEFEGSLTLQDTACVTMEIGSSSTHDQLIVSETVELSGEIKLGLVDGYIPALGDTFELILAETLSNEFATVSLTATDGICADDFDLIYEADHLLLRFNSAGVRLGDVNLDGVVDFFDISPFILVLSAGALQAEADVNKDGDVNFFDISSFIALLSS